MLSRTHTVFYRKQSEKQLESFHWALFLTSFFFGLYLCGYDVAHYCPYECMFEVRMETYVHPHFYCWVPTFGAFTFVSLLFNNDSIGKCCFGPQGIFLHCK